MNRRGRLIATLTILPTLITGSFLLAVPNAQAAARHITVTAQGSVTITPDAVRIYSTVSIIASSSQIALQDVNIKIKAVRDAFLANGIDRKDIKTQNVTVYPEYNYTSDRGSTLIGYRATQSFDVVVKNAANAGVVVDAIVAAGGDSLQINSVVPFLLKDTEATQGARESAVKNARQKASSYAKLLGVKLGKVVFLNEGSTPSFSGPIFAMEKSSDGSTEIELGQQELTLSITVKWAIK
jgi:uncharacterized protein YggE